jgi:hypothetical protein
MWALLKITLVNMTTLITYCIWNIECKVVTSLLGSNLKQVQILLLRKVLIKIHVQSRTTSKMLDIWSSVQLELIDDGK